MCVLASRVSVLHCMALLLPPFASPDQLVLLFLAGIRGLSFAQMSVL
jgi:hypothetical protein